MDAVMMEGSVCKLPDDLVCGFRTFPDEMLPLLCARIDAHSLAALAGTCFQLRELTDKSDVWRHHVQELLRSARGWDLAFQDDSVAATATAHASSTCATWGNLFPAASALQRLPIDPNTRFVADETVDPPHEFTVLLTTDRIHVVQAVAVMWFTGSCPTSYSLLVECNGSWGMCFECEQCEPEYLGEDLQFSRATFPPVECTGVRLVAHELANGRWLSFSGFHVLGKCVPKELTNQIAGCAYISRMLKLRADEWHGVKDYLADAELSVD